MSDEGKSPSREELARRLTGSMKRQLGQFCGFLTEPELVELMLNADGTVWADRLGERMTPIGTMASASTESFIGTVVSTLWSAVTRESPILECELPPDASFDGSRFEALVPPVVAAPVFTIRRKASAVFTLQAYERQGIMSCEHRAAIESAVAQRHNILVVGGTVAPSTYNTGDPIRGITNGYVAGMEAAATAVPSLVAFAPAGPARGSPTHDVTASAGTWNIFAGGSVIPGAVRWNAESPQ